MSGVSNMLGTSLAIVVDIHFRLRAQLVDKCLSKLAVMCVSEIDFRNISERT